MIGEHDPTPSFMSGKHEICHEEHAVGCINKI